jgi:heme/copper-type cytochrome/quinol oxidase subunit 2
MADFIQNHPVGFWSAAVALGVLVLFVIVVARSRKARQGSAKQREITAAATFLVAVVVPALIAILLAGLLPASLWRIGSIVLPAGAGLLGLKYWAKLQSTRGSR